jgi:eukaryotic-like serine/threonine-protein kinase
VTRQTAPSSEPEQSQPTPISRDDASTVIVGEATRPGDASAPSPIEGRLGRFVVLEEVGAGGMGRVLRAYDPKLQREVALKLMHTADATATERMLREAQAMAQLSHPNVLPIFDVGEHEHGLFLAMEFVRGHTLRVWCERQRPQWREVIRVFRDAGEGLAAAHRAGLVHRDFKPDNVLIDADGRVRVMDFGLARAAEGEVVIEAVDASTERPRTGSWAGVLTEVGTVIGTPAYMAPEQHGGVSGDRRSDQYAFCVALYEALHGHRPFRGDSNEALVEAKLAVRLTTPPSNAAPIPGWIDRLVLRGLRPDPDERWPSLDALLAELGRDHARIWRRRGAWILAGLGIAALLGTWARHRAQLCSGSERQLASVWNDERSASLEAAFVATGMHTAADTHARVRTRLDAYAAHWVAAHREACEATRKRGEQSREIMDARMRCLQGRRRDLAALVDTLTNADADVVHKAVEAVLALRPIDRCDDLDYVLAQVAPPDDPKEQARVEELREQLAHARALHAAGRYAEGLPITEAVARDAEELGYAPLLAEAMWRRSELERGVGDYEAARTSLQRAYFEARRSGVDEIAAEASSDLVFLLGARLRHPEDAMRWAEHAGADVERVGTEAMLARVLTNMAIAHTNAGAYDEAQPLYEQAIAILERVAGTDDFSVAPALSGLALLHHGRGASERAVPMFERVLAIREQALGPEHPEIGVALSNLGLAHRAMGAFEEAVEVNERALEIRQQALGPEHPEVAASLANLGSVHFAARDFERAYPMYERALALRERAFGPDHPMIAEILNNLAAAHAARGDHDTSGALHERALAIWEATYGPDHPMVATSLNNLGNVEFARARWDDAADLYRRALESWERTLGADHPHLAHALVGLGKTALEVGRADEALHPLERALAIRRARPGPPVELAEASYMLAQSLWDAPAGAGRDRPRARVLAEQAREIYRDEGHPELLADVDTWLGER